jgi:CRP-like cAMP-binding protein
MTDERPERRRQRGGPAIAAVPFLGGEPGRAVSLLSEEERRRLAVIASAVHVPRGATLYEEGAEATALYNVVQGVVKTYVMQANGAHQITAFLFPDDLFGLAENGHYVNTAQAVTPLTAYRFPLVALERLLRRDPDMEFHFMCKTCHELREAQRHAIVLARRDARGRIAMILHFLECHSSARPLPDGQIAVPMRRSDIAEYCGLTPEAVSRSFRAMQKAGILGFKDPHTVAILDRSRFENLIAGT